MGLPHQRGAALADKEIEIGTLVSLIDVLHINLGIAAIIG